MDRSNEASRILEEARELCRNSDYVRGIELCHQAMGLDDAAVAAAWHVIARAEQERGRLPAALTAFRRTLAARDDLPLTTLNNMGIALYEMGLFSPAAVCFKIVAEKDPRSDFWVLYGACLYNLGRQEEAVAALERAIEIEEDFDEAHHNLGAYLMDADPERAKMCFRRALELDPNRPDSYEGLAALAIGASNWREAEELARNGLSIDPEAVGCRTYLACALARMGKTAEAEKEFLQAIRCKSDTVWIREEYADFLSRQGHSEEAEQQLRSMMHAWPDRERPYESYLEFLRRMPNRDLEVREVEQHLEDVRELLH